MATLSSPGVSVSVINESFYATAGVGTIPLIVVATAQNKIQPGSTTALASGTVKSDAGKLRLMTSQRDALQTYGSPKFYSVGGTPAYDNELNEVGLLTLYEYLGIANTAYVLRADVDLDQLQPSVTEPTGNPKAGDYWLDLSKSSFGIFASNGQTNSAYAWKSKNPSVINDTAYLERIVQGWMVDPSPVVSQSTPVIKFNGTLKINGTALLLTAGDTLSKVIAQINASDALKKSGITATAFTRQQKYFKDGTPLDGAIYGDVCNIRVKITDTTTPIVLTGTTPSILTDLGFDSTTPQNHVLPISSYGSDGDFAVDVISHSVMNDIEDVHQNRIWEKISVTTTFETKSWWFLVGSTDTDYPGWGWKQSTPRVITGSVSNPSFISGQKVSYTIGDSAAHEVTVNINSGERSFDAFIRVMNTSFDDNNINAVAMKKTVGSKKYLQIVNYDSSDIWLHDVSTYTGIAQPLGNAGVSTSTAFFGSIQGTVSSPTFVAPVMTVDSATIAAPGHGYVVSEVLAVTGGTHTSVASLTVSSIKVVNSEPFAITNGGSGYSPRDTLTLTGAGFDSPVILRVEGIDAGGVINEVSIIQSGQYSSEDDAPSSDVQFATTSGNGFGATFNLAWGVNTVTSTATGSYTVFPTSPAVTTTNKVGTGCTLNLVKGYTSANAFSMNFGSAVTKIVYVPGTSLDALVTEINNTWPEFTGIGLPVATKVTSGSQSFLKIMSPNGTTFTLKDISGTPLKTAGIKVGTTFGKQLIYKGFSPSLTVPNTLAELAVDNVWINTTAQDRGASFVVKRYVNNTWVNQNTSPSTGTIPVYSDTTVADAAFGSNKDIGSIFMQYNVNGASPVIAEMVLMRWDGDAWLPLDYTPSITSPVGQPAAGTMWYNTDLMVDIMVSDGQDWKGYANAYPTTDPNGPILDASEPIVQSNGRPLVDNDIWVQTSDIEHYPKIYRYVSGIWVLIDNTDHSSAAGIIFADARPNATGAKTGSTVMANMIKSDYTDPDVPNAELYPDGLLLFNTRYSTNNVKEWVVNYFTKEQYPTLAWRDRWVTKSGNRPDGSPYAGHWAQRQVIVTALKAVIASSEDARAEQATFNLLACPGYTEVLPDLVTLNTDKKEVAFIVADTPARLDPSRISIQDWSTNANGAPLDGADGLITHSNYAALYYPWALTTNLDGNSVLVPPSLMALRTFAYNDQVAYPWFAPAGFNRGLVSGVSSVGYLTADNTYQWLQLSQGQRDSLYINSINPVAYMPNRGLVVYGQKTLAPIASALDRVNVARLINYLNYQLDNLAKPFLFEPNDEQTRKAVNTTFNSFMTNLVSQRALYDFAVVCDDTNNTPARIDRNELWIDVAIKPEKAIEFIYIPIRILNTGDPLPGSNRGTG